jgi:hypothetical protein
MQKKGKVVLLIVIVLLISLNLLACDSAIKFENMAVGNYVELGNYEQDNNFENGKEPIEWLVVSIDENKALLTTKYCIDAIPYNVEAISCTWENCTLRQWLNDEFLSTAFSNREQKIIETSTLSNPDNVYKTYGGNDTKDKVFLFSIQEIGRYNDTLDFVVQATNYAIDKGAHAPETDTSGTMWRLRSPGHTQDRSACVRYNGVVDSWGYPVNWAMAIRPAIWIKF